jgi:hypothetical protein
MFEAAIRRNLEKFIVLNNFNNTYEITRYNNKANSLPFMITRSLIPFLTILGGSRIKDINFCREK